MLLSDQDIRAEMKAGNLKIGAGPADDAVQPASVDLHLGLEFQVFEGHRHEVIRPGRPAAGLTKMVSVHPGDRFVLHPGEFVLGCTLEGVMVGRGLAARIEGKSTLGRLGLMLHSTAGWIDPGFTGQVTLELKNVAPLPIELKPGMPIGQLCVFRLSSPAARPYGAPGLGSRYQGQEGPVAARPSPFADAAWERELMGGPARIPRNLDSDK